MTTKPQEALDRIEHELDCGLILGHENVRKALAWIKNLGEELKAAQTPSCPECLTKYDPDSVDWTTEGRYLVHMPLGMIGHMSEPEMCGRVAFKLQEPGMGRRKAARERA